MEEEEIAATSITEINTALQEILKATLTHNCLTCGICEAAEALDKHHTHLCVLKSNWDEHMYVKMVEALCAEEQINLIKVDDRKKLGEWVGLYKINQERKPQKVAGCSAVVVKDYDEESQVKDVIKDYFKYKKWINKKTLAHLKKKSAGGMEVGTQL